MISFYEFLNFLCKNFNWIRRVQAVVVRVAYASIVHHDIRGFELIFKMKNFSVVSSCELSEKPLVLLFTTKQLFSVVFQACSLCCDLSSRRKTKKNVTSSNQPAT